MDFSGKAREAFSNSESVNRLDDLHEECKRDVCRRMFNNPFFLIYIKSVHEKKINIRYLSRYSITI